MLLKRPRWAKNARKFQNILETFGNTPVLKINWLASAGKTSDIQP
jgi:hypothetical protein